MDAMTATDAQTECRRNITTAASHHFNGFAASELVTPDVSGLDNLAALQGLYAAGVRYVVSNTSITDVLDPGNPGTNPSFNVGRANPSLATIYQVPRHPTNIYYNVGTPAAETDEYNAIYRSYYGYDLTYAQVIDFDSEFGKYYLLRGDIDPLMFHQTNVSDYGGATLLGDWLDAAAAKFLAVSTAPIRTMHQRDIAAAMQARHALDGCGVTATIIESTTGPRSLQLATTGACVVPVTGLAAPTAGSVETYLDPTTSVTMAASSTATIALP
jgi:hypothetical protein